MTTSSPQARLYLNGKMVGTVCLQRADSSWHHGQFQPNDAFSEFALSFGRWSLLMHAEDDQSRQSPEDLDELRKLEVEIDSIRARLLFPEQQEWHTLVQVNIDGPLIEWKEY